MIRRLAFVIAFVIAVAAPAFGQPASGPWSRVLFTAGPIITAGAGSPEGVITASTGSVYLQTDGTAGLVLWTKVGTGATGWSTGGGGGGLSTHTLLGPYHSDSASAGPVRGAVLAANAAPVWARVLPGPAGSVLRYSGTDTNFSTDGTGLTIDAGKATTGTLPASAFPALTGDVTTTAGSLTTAIAPSAVTSAKIANGAVLFADWNLNGCTGGQLAHVNAGGTAWECSDPASGGGSPHALLSTTHSDTNAATAVPGDLLVADAGGLWTRRAVGTTGQVLTVTAGAPTWAAPAGGGGGHVIGLTVDGAGAAITTGVKGYVYVPYSGTIAAATLLSTDASGPATACSIVIDVWKVAYTSYPPTVANTITATAKPTLATAAKSRDTTLTGWTTTVAAGDTVGFKVDSVSGCTRVQLMLTVN